MSKYCKCNPTIHIFYTKGKCDFCRKPIKSIKIRKTWDRKPYTQIKKSDKTYNRKKAKRKLKKRLKEE